MKIFDAHLHIIDPRFPLVPNAGFLPEPFSTHDYRRVAAPLGIVGGTVVSGSFQAFDQSYLESALGRLGPAFVGVTQLPEQASEQEICRLDALGVRALRFNLERRVHQDTQEMVRLARRAFDVAGWHAELYINAAQIPELRPLLGRLPAICVDHLGLTKAGLPHLLRLVELGAKVKATGFGRADLFVADALRRIAGANPDALLFGTDLPSTRAPRPFDPGDLQLVVDALEDETLVDKVLLGNALDLYRPIRNPLLEPGFCGSNAANDSPE